MIASTVAAFAFALAAPSTPTSCVEAFYRASKLGSVRRMAALVYDPARKGTGTLREKQMVAALLGGYKMQVLASSVIGDRGAVRARFTYPPQDGERGSTRVGIVSVRRAAGRWLVVASEAAQTPLSKDAAFFTTRQPWSHTPKTDGPVDRVRELAFACLQSRSGTAGRLTLPNPSAINLLLRYSDRKDYWTGGHWNGPECSINRFELGHKLYNEDVANTVLAYEGSNEKLAFNHGGRAAVAFVDEHGELLTPEEAKSLRWHPWP